MLKVYWFNESTAHCRIRIVQNNSVYGVRDKGQCALLNTYGYFYIKEGKYRPLTKIEEVLYTNQINRIKEFINGQN